MKKENLKKTSKKDLRMYIKYLRKIILSNKSYASHLGEKIDNFQNIVFAKNKEIANMRKTIDTLRSQKNSELEYFDRNFREEKQSMETEIISLKNKLIEKDVALEETKEALSRSRQMNHTLKEFAERNRGEKPSIEQMAENLYEFFHRHVSDRNYMGWKDTAEESKDTFRANVTHIISHTGNAQ